MSHLTYKKKILYTKRKKLFYKTQKKNRQKHFLLRKLCKNKNKKGKNC